METYDDAAFEQFCSELVRLGFSPVPETAQQRWVGPIRDSLRDLTDATTMTVHFYEGWPYHYAHVEVDGLDSAHALSGTICLWAEDDPNQIDGRTAAGLWERLDQWAAEARNGFRRTDRALDAFLFYERQEPTPLVELPLGDLIKLGSNGYKTPLIARTRGRLAALFVTVPVDGSASEETDLHGAFYLRNNIGEPPHTFEDLVASLTAKQKADLDRGLAVRKQVLLGEPSGGYDFVVLAWPRFDDEHDAVVIRFEGADHTFTSASLPATANDVSARKRRAGPDATALQDQTVLIAGAGSVGGHVAVTLANCGVGTMRLYDGQHLVTGNVVRHVLNDTNVGYPKTCALAVEIEHHAPWTKVEYNVALPTNPTELAKHLHGVDLVIDCSGTSYLTAALAHTCAKHKVPLIVGALYNQGAIARVERQTIRDTPILARTPENGYPRLPADPTPVETQGFLELGCTSPVNNASPASVLTVSADIVLAALDELTGRRKRSNDHIIVINPTESPFDKAGTIDSPAVPT